MSLAVRRWLPLLLAVLAVAAALWVLQRPPAREREDPGARRAAAAKPGTTEVAARAGAAGVAARETTISAAGWVRGQVVDTDGHAVGEGALVLWCLGTDDSVARIEGGVLELDEEGRFSGPACRGRAVCPELRHPALVPAEPWSLRPGTETTLEARMLPRLWVRVVDPSGAPVAGAAVGFDLAPDEDDATAVLPVVASQTSSDADGELSVARIERPPCDPCQVARQACPEEPLPVAERVLVTARAPGWAPGSRIVELGSGEGDEDAPFEVTLRPATAAITGTLVDAKGRPLPRAVVLARSQSQPQEQHRAEAGDGTFAFDGLAEGPYAVRAIQDGRELAAQPDVVPGSTVALELDTALRDVELEVVDEEGRPRAGVEVDGGPFGRQRTDARGRVRAKRVAPGPYILRIRGPSPAGPPAGKARAYDLEVPDGEAPEISQPLRLVVAAEG